MEQNENYSKKEGSAAKEPCASILEYLELDALPEKIEWLQKNGHNVCEPGMSKALEHIHRIKEPHDIIKPLSGIFSITWEELKKVIGSGAYEKYLSFDTENKEAVRAVRMVSEFTEEFPCYSRPLLRNIAKLHELKDTDSFEFFFAQHRGMATVIIGISGADGLAYYDYSDEPGFIPLKSPL
ncbi:hypothetical protein [uncultured Flavobacterium sp.]|uniref:hypothetical protein n=1 Tax=uncultured Flavobacterium sp. TaxID=165435 RepID=UPI0025FC5F55|nr:hypothetical protein [uncultured Flavobacterium sp.]